MTGAQPLTVKRKDLEVVRLSAGSWWASVSPQESMTARARQEQARMSLRESMARKVPDQILGEFITGWGN